MQREFVGEQAQFLQDGMKVLVQTLRRKAHRHPAAGAGHAEVVEADAVLRGGTAAPSYKGAVLENGLKIQVPPFIEAGTKIVVSTEDGSYVRRAE